MTTVRLGTALMLPDETSRAARFGIAGISDDGSIITVRYEGYHDLSDGDGFPVLLPDRFRADQPRARFRRDVFLSIRLTRYLGQENATPERVARYLMTNFRANGQVITPMYARELVTGHPEVRTAQEMYSFAYFPGDKIAEQLSFDYIPDNEVDPDPDEDD